MTEALSHFTHKFVEYAQTAGSGVYSFAKSAASSVYSGLVYTKDVLGSAACASGRYLSQTASKAAKVIGPILAQMQKQGAATFTKVRAYSSQNKEPLLVGAAVTGLCVALFVAIKSACGKGNTTPPTG
jgi:hypothetical protein